MKRSDLLVVGQYVSLPRWILAEKRLSPACKLVAMCLIDHLGNNNTTWPGPAVMAKETGLSRDGVKNALRRLVDAGIVSAVVGSKKGSTEWEFISGTPSPSVTNPSVTESAPLGGQNPLPPGILSPRGWGTQSHPSELLEEEQPNEQLKGTTEGSASPPVATANASASCSAPHVSSGRALNGPAPAATRCATNTPIVPKPSTATRQKRNKKEPFPEWAILSADAMGSYLLGHFPEGCRPSKTDWGGGQWPAEGAGTPALAGWAWWMISHGRQRLGLPIVPPPGRLFGASLWHRPRSQVVEAVRVIALRWPDVQQRHWKAAKSEPGVTALLDDEIVNAALSVAAGVPSQTPSRIRPHNDQQRIAQANAQALADIEATVAAKSASNPILRNL